MWPYILVAVGLINIARVETTVIPAHARVAPGTWVSQIAVSYGVLVAGIVWAVVG